MARLQPHPHTAAVAAANTDIAKVVASFRDGPKFMQPHVSPRTQAKHDTIANASPEVQALLDQGYTQEFVHRLAKLTGSE